MLSHSETQHNHNAITCTRYRDGTGSATYEVNLDTGQAR